MLPHYPALLLLLVSSGGADFPPPSHSWRDNHHFPSPDSHPSPREEVHGSREEYEQSSTTSERGAPSSSLPEIKVRYQALPDDVGGPWEKPTVRNKYGSEQVSSVPRGGHVLARQFRRHSLPNTRVTVYQHQHSLTQSHRLQGQTVSHFDSVGNATDWSHDSSPNSQVALITSGKPTDEEGFLPNDTSSQANISGWTNFQRVKSIKRKLHPVSVSGSGTHAGGKVTPSGLLEGIVPHSESPEANLARDHVSSNKLQDPRYGPEFTGAVRRVFLNEISAVASTGDRVREGRRHDRRVNEISPGYASTVGRISEPSHADRGKEWYEGSSSLTRRGFNNNNNSVALGERPDVVQLKKEMGKQLQQEADKELRKEMREQLKGQMGESNSVIISNSPSPPTPLPIFPTVEPRPLSPALRGATSQTRGLHGNISFDELSGKNVAVNEEPQRSPKLNEASPHPDVKLKNSARERGTGWKENGRNAPPAKTADNNKNNSITTTNNKDDNDNKNNIQSKNSLSAGDRADAGWDKEGPEAPWREKRDTQEVRKNASLPVPFQSGGGGGVGHSGRGDSSQAELRWRQSNDGTSYGPPHDSKEINSFKGSEDGKQNDYRASVTGITGRRSKKQDKDGKSAIKPASQNNGAGPSRPRDKSSLEAGPNFLYTPEEEEEEKRTSTSKSFRVESHPSSGQEDEGGDEETWGEESEEEMWDEDEEYETWEEVDGEEDWEGEEEEEGMEDGTWENGEEASATTATTTTRREEVAVARVPLVRQKRGRWSVSSVPIDTPYSAPWNLTQTPAFPSPKYYRVYTETFPGVYTSYILPDINVRDSQRQGSANPPPFSPSGGPEEDDMRGPTYEIQEGEGVAVPDRRASRSLVQYATRSSSVRASKHVRGDRSFVKTPQQRHARSRNRAKRKVPAREVWTLAGDTTLLPCDLTVRLPKDPVQMVMWLREGTHTPLFSVDYREQVGGGPQVWRDNTASTAQRAHLRLAGGDVGMTDGATYRPDVRTHVGYGGMQGGGGVMHGGGGGGGGGGFGLDDGGDADDDMGDDGDGKSGLIVRDMELNDSAVYRCRVDFLLTPTRNTRVNLTVVVPPVRVSVRWWMGNSGNTEENGEVGPFREGDTPTLVCITRNAWPPPRVVWFEEDTMVDDTYASDASMEAVENTLTLEALTRSHHDRRFTCIAANSNLTRPVASTVHIDMALDVLHVEMEKVGTLSAGVQAEVKCTVWGSNPPPIVTWSLSGTILPSAKPWVSNDGNRSVSLVHFTPQPTHDGSELVCSAHNPALTPDTSSSSSSHLHHHLSGRHRHSAILDVNYPPQVTVTLGPSLDATNIKEGDDLYFECSAIAKPPPHKVAWKHNGEELEASPGVLMSNMTLVLQKVARSNAGTYTCHVANKEGSAGSSPISLDVKYAPVCASDKASQHSVAKHENARISCNVLANPPVVQFRWAFNNTAEAVKVPEDRYVMKGTESVVNYTPVTELDYGTLLCWASNDIGLQINPCVFQIVAAGKPDPPHNCRAFDVTISSLQVSCLPGDDGGLGQTFVLEVLETNGDYKPVVEVTRDSPSFSVANLRPATAYRLLVKAKNAKGDSRAAELSAYTVALNHPQHETPAEPTRGRESGSEVAVGVLVGAVLACLPVVIAVVVLGVRTCLKVRAARRGRAEESEKEAAEMEAGGGTAGRPLLTGQVKAGTPGSGGGVSCESGTDITTITGGVAMTTSSTLTPTPTSAHTDTQVTQVVPAETSLLYPGARIYSPNRTQEVVAPQMLAAGAAQMRPRAYPSEEKADGDTELLEVTVPPPAAYNQGYQAAYPAGQPLDQCYQPQGPQRLKPGYPQVFQPVLPGGHMPPVGYPSVAIKGGHTNLQYISSVPLSQGYSPPQLGMATKVPTSSSSYATLPHSKVSESSSFSTLPLSKEACQESKMSTVYNPLTLLASSGQTFLPDTADRVLNTGSLKRGAKLHQGQDVLRIRDNPRSRSASLTSVNSKKESSV